MNATKVLQWEPLPSNSNSVVMARANVPGGWLVQAQDQRNSSITFVPDPEHGWLAPDED